MEIKSINKEELSEIITTSLYGCDWIETNVGKITDSYVEKNQCLEDEWADILLSGGSLICTDLEEEKDYEITYEKVIKGLNKSYIICPFNFNNVIMFDGSGDYYDFNNIWQVIMFGDVIYG